GTAGTRLPVPAAVGGGAVVPGSFHAPGAFAAQQDAGIPVVVDLVRARAVGALDSDELLLAHQGLVRDGDGDHPLVRGVAAHVLSEAEGEVVLVDEVVLGKRALPHRVPGVDGVGEDRLHSRDLPGHTG